VPKTKPKKPVSLEARQRMSRAQLSIKQQKFIREYAATGNGTQSARAAGYKGTSNVLGVTAHGNLRKPNVIAAVNAELLRLEADVSPTRVKRRLDEISHAAQADGQYGPAVRAEELLGKSIGMWIDQSLQLTGVMNDTHVAALLEIARRRQSEPVDLSDDEASHTISHSERDDG
jgi:hypothetical protein